MTQMFHRFPDGMPIRHASGRWPKSIMSTGSEAAMTSLAENYAGLPME